MKRMSGKGIVVLVAGIVLLSGATSAVLSHCEIPCGIYGDPARLDLMAEHITTIEKSMKQIQDLSAAGDKNYNQLVRWVGNKEQHADAFSDIITQYFMKQRIKPAPQSDAGPRQHQQRHAAAARAERGRQNPGRQHQE